jgi:hypothetical protein
MNCSALICFSEPCECGVIMPVKRKCKCCGRDISNKHPNAKFCKTKCKDRFHNMQPHRIERSMKHGKPNVVIKKVTVSKCKLSELLEEKINHPFADMSEYGDRG